MKKYIFFLPILFLVIFAIGVYLYTKSPYSLWLDGPRFVACIAKLEICNPPQSFHVFVAFLFTKIPIGSIISRIQLLSILYSGGALILIYFFILKLFDEKLNTKGSRGTDSAIRFPPASARLAGRQTSQATFDVAANIARPASRQGGSARLREPFLLRHLFRLNMLAALFASTTLAFSYEFWSQSHNVETFILLVLMEIGVFYLLLIGLDEKNFSKRMVLVALIFGLSTGTNPVFMSVFPAPLIILWWYRKKLNWKNLAAFMLIGLFATVLVHAYMPIRAGQNPFINWGRPTNWSGFWEVSTGQGLNVYLPEINRVNGFTGSPVVFLKSSWNFFRMTFLNFTPLIVPFMILGGWYIFTRNKRTFYPLISIAITNFVFSGLYYSGNQESWFMISYVVFVIFAGAGFYYLITNLIYRLPLIQKIRDRSLYKFTNGLVLVPLILLFFHWSMLNRRDFILTQDYIDNLYRPIKTPAILIGSSDLYDSVSLYVHEMEKDEKAKIVPITDNMFYVLKWYRENLQATTPISIPNIDYLGHNDANEYSQYMNNFIKANYKKFNMYITQPSLRNNYLPREDFRPSLIVDEDFQLVPQGMIYEVIHKESTSEPKLAYFDYKFKSKDFPQKKPKFLERVYRDEFTGMFNEYALSYENLADYYARHGKQDLALKYYQKAFDWNPKNSEIVSRLGNYYGSINDHYRAAYYFKKALDLDPKDISLLFNLATASENTGNTQQAVQLYQKILQNAKGNSNIAQSAYQKLNAITNPLPTVPPDVKKYSNASMNLEFNYLPDFSVRNIGQNLIQIANSIQAKDYVSLTIYAKVLGDNESPDKFFTTLPFKINGKFVSSTPNRIGDFEAVVNVYQDGKSQTHLILLRNKDQGFAVKFEPAEKPSAGANVVLQTMKIIKN